MNAQANATRKLIYYVATTADNFIAHEDGTTGDFLEEGHHIPDYFNSLRDYDTVIMGKNTYEYAYDFGLQPGQPAYPNMMHYIFSQSMEAYHNEQLQVIRDDPVDFVRQLKQQEGGAIYLCGGGKIAGLLVDNGLVDELILKVNPVIFGKGIPLFDKSDQCLQLSLEDVKIYKNGVLFIHYAVQYQ